MSVYRYTYAHIMPACACARRGGFSTSRGSTYSYTCLHTYIGLLVCASKEVYTYIYKTNIIYTYIYVYNTYLFMRARRGLYFHSREYIYTYTYICIYSACEWGGPYIDTYTKMLNICECDVCGTTLWCVLLNMFLCDTHEGVLSHTGMCDRNVCQE